MTIDLHQAEELARLLEGQEGLVTRPQLRGLGCTPGTVRWQLGRRWRAVLPSVVSTTGGPLTSRQRLVAALLHAGQESMIASRTAAAWHGVTAADDLRVHVLVPARAHPRDAGFVVVHRTHRPDAHPWRRGGLTICSRARSVVDAARDIGTDEGARAVICEAVERRLVRAEDLRHELESGPRTGSAVVRRAVQDAEAGVWSVAEGDLLRLLARSTILPEVWANPLLEAADGTVLPTPDAWIDAVGLAVQVHSRRWHSAPDQWSSTVMADGALVEHGVTVIGVTPHAVRTDPAGVLRRIERAYGIAAVRPRPPVTARPIGHGSPAREHPLRSGPAHSGRHDGPPRS